MPYGTTMSPKRRLPLHGAGEKKGKDSGEV